MYATCQKLLDSLYESFDNEEFKNDFIRKEDRLMFSIDIINDWIDDGIIYEDWGWKILRCVKENTREFD